MMHVLHGEHIRLRALEPEDLEFLFQIENNETFWEVSHTQVPFSKYTLKQYIANAHQDIYEAKQLRLLIEKTKNSSPIGMLDLFDFSPKHKRAGIGILIAPEHQGKGFASQALNLLTSYCFKYLDLHQLYANVSADNTASLSLFKKNNFLPIGMKKDWIFSKGMFKDEILFQLIHA